MGIKRLFALVMAVCVVALCLTPAMAEDRNLLTVSGPATCAPGSTITLNFGLVAGTNLSAANLYVDYHGAIFDYVSSSVGTAAAGALFADNGDEFGEYMFVIASGTPISRSGTLFTVTFQVDSKATGSYDFYFYSIGFNVDDGTSFGKDLEPNKVKHTVTVEKNTTSSTPVSSATPSNPASSATQSKPITSKPNSSATQSKPITSKPASSVVVSNPASGISSPKAPVDSRENVSGGAVDIEWETHSPNPVASGNDVSAKPQENPVTSAVTNQLPKLGSLSRSWIMITSVALGGTLVVVGGLLLAVLLILKAKNADKTQLQPEKSEKETKE